MDARELAVVVGGLVGTFFLPWPVAEVGKERVTAHAVSEFDQALPSAPERGQANQGVSAVLCGNT